MSRLLIAALLFQVASCKLQWTFNATNGRSFLVHVNLTSAQNRQELLDHLNNIEATSMAPKSPREMKRKLNEIYRLCQFFRESEPYRGDYCTFYFDSFSCWRPAAVGQVQTKPCPVYLVGENAQNITITMRCVQVEAGPTGRKTYKLTLGQARHLGDQGSSLAQYEACFNGTSNPPFIRRLQRQINGRVVKYLRCEKAILAYCHGLDEAILVPQEGCTMALRVSSAPSMSLKVGVLLSPGYSNNCSLSTQCPNRGYGVDMVRIACEYLHLNCTFVWHLTETGTVYPNGSTTGIFNALQRGDYDTAMPSFAPTYQRFKTLDFSHAFAYPEVVLITRAPTMQATLMNWNIIHAFQWPVLVGFFLTLLVAAAFMTMVTSSNFWKTFFALFMFDYNVTMDLSDTTRIVIAVWALATVVLSSTYANVLFSQKVSLTSSFPFTDLETLADCLGLKLCRLITPSLTVAYYADLIQGTSRLSDKFRRAIQDNPSIVMPQYDKIFGAILAETRQYLVLIGLKDLALIQIKGNRDCDFYVVNARYTSTGYTFPFRKGFPMKDRLNRVILHYQQSGINSLVLGKYIGITRDGHCYGQYGMRNWLEEGHGLYSVRTVFLVYGVGIMAAGVLLLMELACKQLRHGLVKQALQFSDFDVGQNSERSSKLERF